jgi:ketosteroid isomerase-like protein
MTRWRGYGGYQGAEMPVMRLARHHRWSKVTPMGDQEIRAAIDRHWEASAAGDQDAEHEIYHDDVVVDYPQSGERIHSRRNLQALRSHHPAKLDFTIRRILGGGNLWITEYVIDYDGKPAFTVSIMEFRDDKVAHETQYFADPFDPPAWRTQWVEPMATA